MTPAPSFTDTNIFVYALAGDDTARSAIAQELGESFWEWRSSIHSE